MVYENLTPKTEPKKKNVALIIKKLLLFYFSPNQGEINMPL